MLMASERDARSTRFSDDNHGPLPPFAEPRAVDARALPKLQLSVPTLRSDRIFRGIVGMGAIFGVIGFAMFGAFSARTLLFSRSGIGDDLDMVLVAPFAAGGIACGLGMLYAGILSLVARGRSIRTLSVPRVATAGAIGGLAPLMVVLASPLWGGTVTGDEVLASLAFFPPLSAAIATATLLIARRVPKE